MDKRVQTIYDRLQSREYRSLRSGKEYSFAQDYAAAGTDPALRAADRLMKMAQAERAVLFAEDRIGMMRTVKKVPPIFTDEEFAAIAAEHFIFDGAQVNNISSDYASALDGGMEKKRNRILELRAKEQEGSKKYVLYTAMLTSIDALYLIAEKYRAEAERMGNERLAEALSNVPENTPRGYYEALVMLRLLNYTLWLNANKHNTLGRFDVYMFPFYEKDIKSGALAREEALSLTQEFFIDLNFDADLYPGVQQGDNGQSMVLGGCDADGMPVYNDLSKLCLEASLELKIIDPKINLRVDKNTPEEVYLLGTELTKQGLGFPQYSNDDVVIPALVNWGYDLADARNYVVAACWEFIIPGLAMDIPNIDALNFPGIVRKVTERIKEFPDYGSFLAEVKKDILAECDRLTSMTKGLYLMPSPFQSVLMTNCIEEGKDISEGTKYNNYGFHGAGVSTAADSIAAVRKCVYEEKSISAEQLLAALAADFEGYADVRNKLLAAPKMGQNDDYADGIAVQLLDWFADGLEGKHNDRGGIFRAGTGSAMYYIWCSSELGATADGRKAGAPFAANFSPSLDVPLEGVLSVIQSFTKPHLTRVCNGGPLTLEFHDTLFRNEEGTKKVAKLVELFVKKGGHQMQLNAVNREKMLDAKAHPEKYPNLIVRVWGWSGYFNELDTVYQDQIIKRLEFLQ